MVGPDGTNVRVYRATVPQLWYVLPIGHYWFALLFGYLGGHFARFVYVRRMKEQAAHAKD
jgi:hypothetical protein